MDSGIWSVPISGGTTTRIVGASTDSSNPSRYGWPNWSPDGERLVYTRVPGDSTSERAELWVLEVGAPSTARRLVGELRQLGRQSQ
jgi:hypothetical protein